METYKVIAVGDEKTWQPLIQKGWEVVSSYEGGSGVTRLLLKPPVEFEIHKMIQSGVCLVVQREGKSPTLEGSAQAELARLSADGWELVQVLAEEGGRREFWFKRQKRTREKFVSHAGTDGPTVS